MPGSDQLQLKYPTTYHLQAVKTRQRFVDGSSFTMDDDSLMSETDYVDMGQLSYVSELDDVGHAALPLKMSPEPMFQHPSMEVHPYQIDPRTMPTSSIPIGIKTSLPYSHQMLQETRGHGWSAPDSPGQTNAAWSSTPNQPYSMDHASLSASSYEDDPRTQAK
jgi:hypothetical protein